MDLDDNMYIRSMRRFGEIVSTAGKKCFVASRPSLRSDFKYR